MFFLLFIFCMLRWCAVQAELDLIIDDASCVYANEEYVKPGSCSIEVNDDSEYETSLTTHVEIIKQFPEGLKARGNVNGIQMGEYTNDIGLHVQMDLCDEAFSGHNIARVIVEGININPKNCPPEPGIYGKADYVIDNFEGLPDSFLTGKYLLNVTILNEDTLFLNYFIYVSVL
ncbi:uncharacterized protein LOC143146030 [Ptiloglossa arizonensis]|uniref:uncharacterized protein LOC143146030 n=1 Tax=Ptiloglossa arizonensis TaxID=3350558 RepID=UPI003FA03527